MTVTQTGATEAAARLEAMAARLRDLSPVMAVIAADTMTVIDDSFAQSRSPDGSPWAPLSDVTLMARARDAAGPSRITNRMIGPMPEGTSRTRTRRWTRRRSEAAAAAVFNAKPLIDTGRLRSSAFARPKKTGLQFGTNVAYAGAHQFGSLNRPWGKGARRPYDARPFLPVTKFGSAFTLTATGPGGAHWSRARESIRRYITEGVVS